MSPPRKPASFASFLALVACIGTLAARSDRDPPGEERREVVLCIGDSFTDGAGPDGAAACYPAALAKKLESEAPGRFLVVQRSYPGGDSRRLLLDLRAVLERVRPELTYVLIGVNDGYSIPDPVTDEESRAASLELDREGAAVLRCFVGGNARFVPGLSVEDPRWDGVATGGSGPASAPAGADASDGSSPVGIWHVATETIEFRADGTLATRFGRFAWNLVDGRLVVAGNGVAHELVIRRDRDRCVLTRLDGVPVVALEPGPAVEEGVAADLEDRRAGFEAAGNWISALWLARAEIEADRIEDAAGRCAWILARSAFNYPALELLKRLARPAATRERALAGLRHAHESLAADDPTRSTIERLDALFRSPDDPDECARLLLSAHARERDRRATLRAFRNDSSILAEHVERAIAASPYDDRVEEEFREAFTALPDLDRAIAGVLEDHLSMIAAVCEARGSDAVVLTYPRPPKSIEPAFTALTERGGVAVLEVHRVFESMTDSERAKHVASDGHCTALGYRRVAELVAEDVLARRR